jgi:iron(III) transport system ATP-binding protein
VKAEIVGVSFFGHDATVQARVAGSDLVVTARTPAGGVPTTGQQVTLRVVGTVLAFPDPEAS